MASSGDHSRPKHGNEQHQTSDGNEFEAARQVYAHNINKYTQEMDTLMKSQDNLKLDSNSMIKGFVDRILYEEGTLTRARSCRENRISTASASAAAPGLTTSASAAAHDSGTPSAIRIEQS